MTVDPGERRSARGGQPRTQLAQGRCEASKREQERRLSEIGCESARVLYSKAVQLVGSRRWSSVAQRPRGRRPRRATCAVGNRD